MNYLQLCQRLVRETGIADSGPSSVSGQTGDMKRVVDWVNDSWVKIQSLRKNWYWMWAQNTLNLAEGSSTLTPALAFERIDFLRADGALLQEIDYDDFARAYPTLPSNRPSAYCILPNGTIQFNAVANKAYSVTYDYFKSPTYFVNGTDTPAIPERYRMLIVWDSLRQYAQFDDAPELERKAVLNWDDMLADLERDQLPAIEVPGAIG